mmetsp:Transcript_16449/g.23393  ORF Transcript_16449/g.23393 Transcript_16449/m.23393 type:complete len:704 (-) Transcript_16449:120-2231(-)|eukprot:CAMPEP_0184863486 /NCGR_PEP_ID=MMETSP0580-20130426/11289_1 /TAXON_ID=1118495 /ORGANISM="Dactyliosolen fragilissimus" /LENGTH=703 /DNA_ID=CAMNT_0027361843 /DNA_START=39 /DNA_END=2150 /DNA_ORIENTATION=+
MILELTAGGGSAVILYSIYKYKETKNQLSDISENAENVLKMQRRKDWKEDEGKEGEFSMRGEIGREVELLPSYVKFIEGRCNEDGEFVSRLGVEGKMRFMSLGDYLQSLEPAPENDSKKTRVEEIDLLLANALLKMLGPHLSFAIMPALTLMTSGVSKAGAKATDAMAAMAGMGVAGGEDQESIARLASTAPAMFMRSLGGLSLLSVGGLGDSKGAKAWAANIAKRNVVRERLAMKKLHRRGKKEKVNLANENGKLSSAEEDEELKKMEMELDTPLRLMKSGEMVFKYGNKLPLEQAVPNPFILSVHWKRAVDLMIGQLMNENPEFDPEEYTLFPNKPVNEDVLPDLHFGCGAIRCTQTNRQIVENRYLCVLLNKLASNFVPVNHESNLPDMGIHVDNDNSEKITYPSPEPFVVKLNPGDQNKIVTPCQFFEALQKSGHNVRASRNIRSTTFGFKLCVWDGEGEKADREDPANWIQIPLGLSVRSGLQTPDAQSIPAYFTHTGIEYEVRGPTVNGMLQFFHHQNGFAGFSPGEYANGPWMFDAVDLNLDPIQAVRVSSFLAVFLNMAAYDKAIPNGGYGLTGVCNDSAAAIEMAITGSTDVYPCCALGGAFHHIVSAGHKFKRAVLDTHPHEYLTFNNDMKRDLTSLLGAIQKLPSDIHPTIMTAGDTARRIRASIPRQPMFKRMSETIDLLDQFEAERKSWQ